MWKPQWCCKKIYKHESQVRRGWKSGPLATNGDMKYCIAPRDYFFSVKESDTAVFQSGANWWDNDFLGMNPFSVQGYVKQYQSKRIISVHRTTLETPSPNRTTFAASSDHSKATTNHCRKNRETVALNFATFDHPWFPKMGGFPFGCSLF